MDSARPTNAKNLLSLKQAADKLSVSAEVLLNLNEYNILKPTITLSGEIGYTQAQIDNFLSIKQLTAQVSVADSTKKEAILPSQPPLLKAEFNKSFFHVSSKIDNNFTGDKSVNKHFEAISQTPFTKRGKITSFLTISSMSFMLFLTIFSLTAPIGGTKPSVSGADSKTGVLHIQHSNRSPLPTQPYNSAANNNLGKENISPLNEDIASLNQAFENKTKKNAENSEIAKTTDFPLPESSIKSGTRTGANESISFASKPSCPSCVNEDNMEDKSIFDEEGNIKGEQPSDSNLLATTSVGAARITHDNSSTKQTTNPALLWGFSAIGLLSLMFIFKNQLAYAFNKTGNSEIEPNKYPIATEPQRILEVRQKTDGTVVLLIRGKEHKISKPELDSESDQFITRLMELAENDAKEIDYDTLGDKEIRFNAPLSKLVTRLGFVGIKRDLFFPRTSKNKVLFRKYITEQDLIAMSLTTEQISNYL